MINKLKALFIQFVHFGIVGGLSFILDYSIMLGLIELFDMHYMPATAISFSIATIFNYFLSIKWVFTNKKEHKKTLELTVFLILSLFGLGINEIIMWICTDTFFIDYRLSKLIATAVVTVWNFISRKIFLEKWEPKSTK